jgi:hypothetical protein
MVLDEGSLGPWSMTLRSMVRAATMDAMVSMSVTSLALSYFCLTSTSYEARNTCFVYSLPSYLYVLTSQFLLMSIPPLRVVWKDLDILIWILCSLLLILILIVLWAKCSVPPTV